MRFGICAPPAERKAMTLAGYDYLEPAVTGALQPEQPETEVMPLLKEQFASSALKPEAFNVFLPGDLKVVGPATDPKREEGYLDSAFRRVRMLGGEVIVFGSGVARRRPEGWPEADANRQVLEFLGRCGEAAQHHGVVVAIEPLNISECNFINSVAEAAALAAKLGHPAVGVLSDLYHVAHDGQSYDETRNAAYWLRHVHVAGAGRRSPVPADHDFLAAYLSVLKQIGYAGRISIEANWENLGEQAAEALQVLQRAWDAA